MIVQLVVTAGNKSGQVVPVSTEKFIIGRAKDCHLRPKSEMISRYHCAIFVGDDVVIRDLGSRNGVHLNGEKVQTEHNLVHGDKLEIGPLEFSVQIDRDSLPDVPGDGLDSGWDQHGSKDDEASHPTLFAPLSKYLSNQEKN